MINNAELTARSLVLIKEMLAELIKAENVLSDYIEQLEKTPMTQLYYGRECLESIRSVIKKVQSL